MIELSAKSAVAISPFKTLALVIELSAKSAVAISPSKILALVTASAANLALLIAKLLITGAAALEFVPPKSPANLILPRVKSSALGVPPEVTCAST